MSDINTRTFEVDANGDFHSVDDKPETSHTESVSVFAYENALMHKDSDCERAHRTTLFVCITFVIITVIFVLAYTVRMNSFLNTINQLTAEIVRLAYAKGIAAP